MGTRAGPPEGTPPPGDVVVITGASSGIGRATAHAFAGHGARLVLAARAPDSLEDVAAECAALGAQTVAVPTDVAREADVEALMAAALRAYGRVDAWVGCASAYSYGTFEDTPSAVFRRIVETTLFGQVHGARAVLPHFRSRGRGTLVLVGSVFSKVSAPYISPYVTGKFGLLGFAEVLRHEYRDAPRISICAVLPATIDTPIYQHAANYTRRTVHPLPPVVAPERVARAIVRSVRRPRPVRVVGRLQGAAIPFHGILPGLYARCIHSLMDVLALRRGPTSPAAGTVFTPDPSTNRVAGGWRTAGGLRSWPYRLRSARQRKPPSRGGEPAPGSGTGA